MFRNMYFETTTNLTNAYVVCLAIKSDEIASTSFYRLTINAVVS